MSAAPPPLPRPRAVPSDAVSDPLHGDLLRIALLGLNVWAVSLAIPALDASRSASVGLFAALLVPLAALALALATLRARHPAAAFATLGAFPVALALGVGARPELQRGDAHTPLTLCVAVLSLVAWATAAAHALGRAPRGRSTTLQPLGPRSEASPGRQRRTRARRALLAVASLGAVALVSVAPALLDRGEAERVWGEAAPEGVLFATIAGGALATLLLGGVIGPSLRAGRATAASRPSWLRVGFAVVAFGTGLAAWAVYARAR
jgi:hypothetical protein